MSLHIFDVTDKKIAKTLILCIWQNSMMGNSEDKEEYFGMMATEDILSNVDNE